jgi:hypothetical protein
VTSSAAPPPRHTNRSAAKDDLLTWVQDLGKTASGDEDADVSGPTVRAVPHRSTPSSPTELPWPSQVGYRSRHAIPEGPPTD